VTGRTLARAGLLSASSRDRNASRKTPEKVVVVGCRYRRNPALLDLGADVNWNARGGWLLVHCITNYGNYLDIAQLLLDHVADPATGRWGNGTGETTLGTAAEFGRVKMVDLFLERDAQEKIFHQKHFNRALHNAARENNLKTVEILIKHGRVNLNFQDSWGCTSLASCLGGSNPEIVRLLLDNEPTLMF
jgi:ankyrin repeat protein